MQSDSQGKPPKPSEIFEEAFSDHTGSRWELCELCGTTIYATADPSYYEPDELEELERKAKENPKAYVEWGDVDGVSRGMIDGRTFVRDHECPALGKYEAFIWRHRFQIAEYLKKRSKEELDVATDQAARIGVLDLSQTSPEGGDIRRTRPGDLGTPP